MSDWQGKSGAHLNPLPRPPQPMTILKTAEFNSAFEQRKVR